VRHHIDRCHRVVDQQAESDDQRTERNTLQINLEKFHDRKNNRHRQRDRQGDHCAGPESKAEYAAGHDDGDGLPERYHKFANSVFHHRCARRERDSVAMVDFHPARYGCTKSHGRWWIMDRDADLKGARDRISLRVDLPHSALCGDTGIVGQSDDHISVARSSARHLSRRP
jgi:hypothetical protein